MSILFHSTSDKKFGPAESCGVYTTEDDVKWVCSFCVCVYIHYTVLREGSGVNAPQGIIKWGGCWLQNPVGFEHQKCMVMSCCFMEWEYFKHLIKFLFIQPLHKLSKKFNFGKNTSLSCFSVFFSLKIIGKLTSSDRNF